MDHPTLILQNSPPTDASGMRTRPCTCLRVAALAKTGRHLLSVNLHRSTNLLDFTFGEESRLSHAAFLWTSMDPLEIFCMRSNKSFRVHLHSKRPPCSIRKRITVAYFTIRSFFTDLTPSTLRAIS